MDKSIFMGIVACAMAIKSMRPEKRRNVLAYTRNRDRTKMNFLNIMPFITERRFSTVESEILPFVLNRRNSTGVSLCDRPVDVHTQVDIVWLEPFVFPEGLEIRPDLIPISKPDPISPHQTLENWMQLPMLTFNHMTVFRAVAPRFEDGTLGYALWPLYRLCLWTMFSEK